MRKEKYDMSWNKVRNIEKCVICNKLTNQVLSVRWHGYCIQLHIHSDCHFKQNDIRILRKMMDTIIVIEEEK